jgi:hypothetical protein
VPQLFGNVDHSIDQFDWPILRIWFLFVYLLETSYAAVRLLGYNLHFVCFWLSLRWVWQTKGISVAGQPRQGRVQGQEKEDQHLDDRSLLLHNVMANGDDGQFLLLCRSQQDIKSIQREGQKRAVILGYQTSVY